MRFAIAAILVLHGAIHLLGIKLAPNRIEAALWVVVSIVILAGALLRLLDRDGWWLFAAVGVVASQILIVRQWSDARAGTILNVVLVAPVIVGFATARFHRANEEHARALLAGVTDPASATPLRPDEVAALPPPVRHWLEASGAVGKPRARTVRLVQRGEMRTKPDGGFAHAEAKQYFTVDRPGFVWTVDVSMMGLPVVGRDSWVDGRARMFIQAAGLVTVADGTGERFDQGTLLRYLGEIIWFPSAAVVPFIIWEPIDEHSARATLSHLGTTGSAVFTFDDAGRLVKLAAKRYFNGESLEDWEIPITEWKTLRGIEMPTRGGAVWKLAPEKGGDYEYYRWEIVDVETNRATLWGED